MKAITPTSLHDTQRGVQYLFEITEPRHITVSTTQIQYSQLVLLVFAGLVWPHASVATLVPNDPIPIPRSAWGQP